MSISAVILAGGLATRMKGVDKGLILLNQKPLVQHVIERLIVKLQSIRLLAIPCYKTKLKIF